MVVEAAMEMRRRLVYLTAGVTWAEAEWLYSVLEVAMAVARAPDRPSLGQERSPVPRASVRWWWRALLMWAREGCLERDLNAATAARALGRRKWASPEEGVVVVVETTVTAHVHVVAEVEVDATAMVPVLAPVVEAAAVPLARKSWGALTGTEEVAVILAAVVGALAPAVVEAAAVPLARKSWGA